MTFIFLNKRDSSLLYIPIFKISSILYSKNKEKKQLYTSRFKKTVHVYIPRLIRYSFHFNIPRLKGNISWELLV